MNKPVRVILLDDADIAYKKLNEIVGKQMVEGKTNLDIRENRFNKKVF